ncbi:cytochrome c oxidase subunit 7A1 isoform X2 [Rattus norvegicus]|uniref:cytochrome c oxidase subunit 7A1 isoform X2 n=1 Tax=Rattus norvegicus TaxID=10116 RepID=UPI0004E4954C|eukprot:XP_008757457.1 PREDICTED: cytochrome c oxidase subunit 7A1, mitochondrial isoform X1 [Rattus norvegicus]
MRALRVSQALIRSFTSSTRSHLENRVAQKQKLFQADNDLPVHLKGGGMDNILYRLTMTLTLGEAQRGGTARGQFQGSQGYITDRACGKKEMADRDL